MEKKFEVKRTQIIDAWAWIRRNNNSIPDDILDLMKDAALQYDKLKAELESLKTDLDFSNEVKKECYLKIQQLESDNKVLLDALKVIEQNCEFTLTDQFKGDIKTQIQFALNRCKEAIKKVEP